MFEALGLEGQENPSELPFYFLAVKCYEYQGEEFRTGCKFREWFKEREKNIP